MSGAHCTTCKNLRTLIKLHAGQCTHSGSRCPVPFCTRLRKSMKVTMEVVHAEEGAVDESGEPAQLALRMKRIRSNAAEEEPKTKTIYASVSDFRPVRFSFGGLYSPPPPLALSLFDNDACAARRRNRSFRSASNLSLTRPGLNSRKRRTRSPLKRSTRVRESPLPLPTKGGRAGVAMLIAEQNLART